MLNAQENRPDLHITILRMTQAFLELHRESVFSVNHLDFPARLGEGLHLSGA